MKPYCAEKQQAKIGYAAWREASSAFELWCVWRGNARIGEIKHRRSSAAAA